MNTTIPAFTGFADDTEQRLLDLAAAWAASSQRPRVKTEILIYWDDLIRRWVADMDMPLPVRRKGLRGNVAPHAATGRLLLCVDNAPANWCMSNALLGNRPTIQEVRRALADGRLPVAKVLTNPERELAVYTGLQGHRTDPPNLNTLKWKVCHIRPVGLNNKQTTTQIALDVLQEHALRLLHPGNMFLVPLRYGGLGESPEFLRVFQDALTHDSARGI